MSDHRFTGDLIEIADRLDTHAGHMLLAGFAAHGPVIADIRDIEGEIRRLATIDHEEDKP